MVLRQFNESVTTMESQMPLTLAEQSTALQRLRATCQMLVAEVGASGPCNAEEAAERAVVMIQQLRRDRLALLRVLEAILIEVEPLRYEQQQAIERACEAKRKWADEHNAREAHTNDIWCYMSEYRRSLEEATHPLTAAVREANQVFDDISAARCSEQLDLAVTAKPE